MLDVGIPGVHLKPLTLHRDERGSFAEILRSREYPETFVQSNYSFSRKGVLRGLHYHRHQADLWFVVSGSLQVGLADLRQPADPNLMTTTTLNLKSDEPKSLYIPRGVAHGYLALTDVILIYWVTKEYDATDEYGIMWNDSQLALNWAATDKVILSDRDKDNEPLLWDKIAHFS